MSKLFANGRQQTTLVGQELWRFSCWVFVKLFTFFLKSFPFHLISVFGKLIMYGRITVFIIYHWHRVKHIVLPLAQNNNIWWSNITCYFTLVYHTYFESNTEILVFQNTFIDSNEQVFWVNSQYAKCQTSMHKQRIGNGFSGFLDKCSLQVVTAKFDMSDYLVRRILKAKMYKFWSGNVLVKCNSCNNLVIWLFNLSPFAAKYCLVMWGKSLCHLQTIRSMKQDS